MPWYCSNDSTAIPIHAIHNMHAGIFRSQQHSDYCVECSLSEGGVDYMYNKLDLNCVSFRGWNVMNGLIQWNRKHHPIRHLPFFNLTEKSGREISIRLPDSPVRILILEFSTISPNSDGVIRNSDGNFSARLHVRLKKGRCLLDKLDGCNVHDLHCECAGRMC